MSYRTWVGAILIALTAALLVAAAAGCSRGADETGASTPVPRERDDDGLRTVSADGRDVVVATTRGSLPEEWPHEVPIPVDASVASAETIAVDGGDAVVYSAGMSSREDFDEVVAWYASALVAAGWTIDDQATSGNEGFRGAGFSASRTGGALSVAVREADDVTYIHLEAGLSAEGGG